MFISFSESLLEMRRRATRPRTCLSVAFPATVTADAFEEQLKACGVRSDLTTAITFDHTSVTFAPIDALVSMVCLYNRLAHEGADVEVRWDATQDSFGYAERVGFFALLDARVRVTPERPPRGSSSFELYQRRNKNVLEMRSLNLGAHDSADEVISTLPDQLGEILGAGEGRSDAVNRIWTCASETIENIYEHSESPVPGVVAAQLYASGSRGPRVELVIADAGLGLLTTIRRGNPRAAGTKTDVALILEAFSKGLSSKLEPGRGCGLTQCAALAMKYEGNLRVRTASTWVKLVTKSQKGWTIGIYDEKAAMVTGTQLVFTFYLDRVSRVANLVH